MERVFCLNFAFFLLLDTSFLKICFNNLVHISFRGRVILEKNFVIDLGGSTFVAKQERHEGKNY